MKQFSYWYAQLILSIFLMHQLRDDDLVSCMFIEDVPE